MAQENNQKQTKIKYTFWTYNPHFWHKNIPFGVLTHVESVVCLTRTANNLLKTKDALHYGTE